MNKKIITPAMNAINETFGYDRPGCHLKKCEICECEYEEPNDLNYLIMHGPERCPHCKEIIELRDVLIKYSDSFKDMEWDDPIHDKNMIKDNEYETEFGKTETFTLDKFESKTIIVNRTKKIKDLIDRIYKARDFLYFNLEPKIQILRSIFHNHDRFWKDGGNFVYQIKEVTVEYIVIKLNEFLSTNINNDNYKYSISKIRNIINNDKKAIYDRQKIVLEKTFNRSGDIQKTEYPRFQIEEYLSKLDKVLDEYRSIIKAIDDYRDTQFAHIDELKNPDSEAQLTYKNIIKIFNSLKIIYDGFLYSVAPDLFAQKVVDFNIWYWRLNQISQYYDDYFTKPRKEKDSSDKKE